jgi:hypothetical protein
MGEGQRKSVHSVRVNGENLIFGARSAHTGCVSEMRLARPCAGATVSRFTTFNHDLRPWFPLTTN